MVLVELTTVQAEVLPVLEFSSHLHLGTGFADDGAQNAVLEAYLRAAMAAIETRIGKALIARNFSWQLTSWRSGDMQGLPVAPISQILAVKVVDRTGSETLISPEAYDLVKDSQRPVLQARGAALPSIPAGGTAEIEFTAGYGAGWADLPVDLAQAVFLLGAHYYENRRGEGGRDELIPFGVLALIEAYRSIRILGGAI